MIQNYQNPTGGSVDELVINFRDYIDKNSENLDKPLDCGYEELGLSSEQWEKMKTSPMLPVKILTYSQEFKNSVSSGGYQPKTEYTLYGFLSNGIFYAGQGTSDYLSKINSNYFIYDDYHKTAEVRLYGKVGFSASNTFIGYQHVYTGY